MKLTYKIQIVIVHLWFLVCLYLMITENNKIEYIGKVESEKTELYEIFFYISLFILIVFYISIIGRHLLKKSD